MIADTFAYRIDLFPVEPVLLSCRRTRPEGMQMVDPRKRIMEPLLPALAIGDGSAQAAVSAGNHGSLPIVASAARVDVGIDAAGQAALDAREHEAMQPAWRARLAARDLALAGC